MTTYPDQPLSRRAVREREAEAARAASATSDAPESTSAEPVTAQPATAEPLTYVTQGRAPLPQYDAPLAQQPAAEATPAEASTDTDAYRYRDFSPEGRRAARFAGPPTVAESSDLDYRTQGRAEVPPPAAPVAVPVADPLLAEPPATGTLSRREMRAIRDAQDREAGIVPISDEPEQFAPEQPGYAAPPAYAAPPSYSAPPAYSAPPVDEPQAPAETPAWMAAFAAPSVADAAAPEAPAAPAFDDILIGETVDDADDAASGPVVVAEEVREVPPPLIEPAAPPTDALASFEALFHSDTGATPAQPAADTPPVSPVFAAPFAAPIASPQPFTAFPPPVVSATAPPAAVQPVEAPPVVDAPPVDAPVEAAADAPAAPAFAQYNAGLQPPSPFDQTTVPPPGGELPPVAPAAAPLNLTFLPTSSVPVQSAPPFEADAAAVALAASTTSQPPVAGERPRNHWSRQAELDDEAQPATGALTRSVGVSSGTANALVLPEIPNSDMIATPLTSTGDVLVTGSISLPSSLSSTGALPAQLDESDLDHLLDPGDHQVASTDSQPVRAIRAVSTHTSSREIIGTIKPKRSNRALTVLIISAAGMAVVVVTLLVVALVSGVLG